jgi:hypothetical protein
MVFCTYLGAAKCSAVGQSSVNYFTFDRYLSKINRRLPGRPYPNQAGPGPFVDKNGRAGTRTETNAGRGSAAIAPFELGGSFWLRQKAATAEPHLVDRSVAPANAPDIFAMAGEPGGETETAAIRTG